MNSTLNHLFASTSAYSPFLMVNGHSSFILKGSHLFNLFNSALFTINTRRIEVSYSRFDKCLCSAVKSTENPLIYAYKKYHQSLSLFSDKIDVRFCKFDKISDYGVHLESPGSISIYSSVVSNSLYGFFANCTHLLFIRNCASFNYASSFSGFRCVASQSGVVDYFLSNWCSSIEHNNGDDSSWCHSAFHSVSNFNVSGGYSFDATGLLLIYVHTDQHLSFFTISSTSGHKALEFHSNTEKTDLEYISMHNNSLSWSAFQISITQIFIRDSVVFTSGTRLVHVNNFTSIDNLYTDIITTLPGVVSTDEPTLLPQMLKEGYECAFTSLFTQPSALSVRFKQHLIFSTFLLS